MTILKTPSPKSILVATQTKDGAVPHLKVDGIKGQKSRLFPVAVSTPINGQFPEALVTAQDGFAVYVFEDGKLLTAKEIRRLLGQGPSLEREHRMARREAST